MYRGDNIRTIPFNYPNRQPIKTEHTIVINYIDVNSFSRGLIILFCSMNGYWSILPTSNFIY